MLDIKLLPDSLSCAMAVVVVFVLPSVIVAQIYRDEWICPGTVPEHIFLVPNIRSAPVSCSSHGLGVVCKGNCAHSRANGLSTQLLDDRAFLIEVS